MGVGGGVVGGCGEQMMPVYTSYGASQHNGIHAVAVHLFGQHMACSIVCMLCHTRAIANDIRRAGRLMVMSLHVW